MNPLTDLSQVLIGELGRMFLAWFLDSKMSGSTFKGKNSKNRYLRPSAGKRRE